MLDGLRLRGLRSLGDTGRIDFKPITLLLGQNSSGKSTFLRSLPLLRQSIMTRTNSPVLWYGDLVDFGSFQEVLSSFSSTKSISFDFFIKSLRLTNPYYGSQHHNGKSINDVKLAIELNESDDFTRLASLNLRLGEDEVMINVDRKSFVTSIVINGIDMAKAIPKERFYLSKVDLVPQVVAAAERDRSTSYYISSKPLFLSESAIHSFFSGHFDRRVSENTIKGIARKLSYSAREDFATKLQASRSDLVSWTSIKNLIPYYKGAQGIEYLRNLYLVGLLPDILYSINVSLGQSLRELAYVGPSRATGERYYRHQELAIDQIDPQGQNLAMFLYSLETARRADFSTWLEDQIGYSLQVGRKGGHVQIELKERGGDSYHNLADMGYGFSQILPVMAQIWGRQLKRGGLFAPKPFVAIEQPELHLHPAYQARLADVFANSVHASADDKERTTFLIETHSEALINRLGQLIYEKKLQADDVAIYLFHRLAKTDSTTVSRASFNKDGVLIDWPLGFFSSRAAK